MRKLELKKEHLGNLTSEELVNVVAAAEAIARTVRDTECGGQCVGTWPINQCWLSFGC